MARRRLQPGDTFESYEIVGLLGEGGRGSVFEAVETFSRRPVALKVLKVEIEAGPHSDAVQRARAEAMALARIQHPNVVQMLAAGVSANGAPWLATELVRGVSLRTYAARHKLSLPRAMRIVLELCEGVAAAHEHGTIHRDIKPENVLVTEQGQVKVIDFNIAKLYDANTFVKSTMPGQQPGTPAYMTPEQIHGEPIGAYTDVYLVGVIAYELFGHRYVFLQADGSFPEGVLALGAHLFQTPRPLAELGVPEGIAAVVMRALSKVPAQRQQTMVELASGLRAAFQAWLQAHPEEDSYGRPSMQNPGTRREHVPPTSLAEQATAPELPDSSVVVRVPERVPPPAALAAPKAASASRPRSALAALAKTETFTSPIPARQPVHVPTTELPPMHGERSTLVMPPPASAPATPPGGVPARYSPQPLAPTSTPMPAAALTPQASVQAPRPARRTLVSKPSSNRSAVLALALSVPAIVGGVIAGFIWLRMQHSEAAPAVDPSAVSVQPTPPEAPSAEVEPTGSATEVVPPTPAPQGAASTTTAPSTAPAAPPKAPNQAAATATAAAKPAASNKPAAVPPWETPSAPPKPTSAKDADPAEDRIPRF